MTYGLHDIVKRLKTALEIKEQFPMYLSRKLNLVYLVNSVPEYQGLNATQAAAVQNTWYTLFDDYNVVFAGLAVYVTVANETLEIRVTLDDELITCVAGTALTFGANPYSQVTSLLVTNSGKFIGMGAAAGNMYTEALLPQWCYGRHVKIEVRKTTNAGASAVGLVGVYHQFS